MHVLCGIDMVPRLTLSTNDREAWADFILAIKNKYRNDRKVVVRPHFLLFRTTQQHLKLPVQGHKFLRFGCDVSGAKHVVAGAKAYVVAVGDLARQFFRTRIRVWDEEDGQSGFYNPVTVRASIRNYDKVSVRSDKSAMQGKALTDVVSLPQFVDTSMATIPASPSWVGVDKFAITSIPCKGLGMVALVEIPRGTLIIRERPLFLQHVAPDRTLEPKLADNMSKLSSADQRRFLSLYNGFAELGPLLGTFLTNKVECTHMSSLYGVYPTVSRINHCCQPNSHYSWDGGKVSQAVYAMQPLRPGDEVTITYGRGGIFSDQQTFLRVRHGFCCDCRRCSLSEAELTKSDDRRVLLQRLDDDLGDCYCTKNTPGESLSVIRTLLRLFREEYGGYSCVHSLRLYFNGFQISVAHGDLARSAAFLHKAHAESILCRGYTHPGTEVIRKLALKPEVYHGHELCSTRWRQARDRIPEDLSDDDFTNWLFRGQREYTTAEMEILYPKDTGVQM